ADASALVVARGGQIMAEGTAESPIVFTYEADPLDGSVPYSTRGQWGGLIVLGNAGLNSTPGQTQIEGIPETEPRGLYGGDNDEDNSGVLRYISIRHGGTDIGAGNEINGLTLGGVGSETVVEYIEVISNADDGIEFFGGTASVKYATVAFCSDDSYDYDEGWRGKGQFWLTVQDDNGGGLGDRGGEHDGGTDPEDAAPYAHPVIYNATYMGRGLDAGRRALTFRDNAAGEYHNSIFYNWGRGIDVENLASGEDSYQRLVDGDLAFAGNCFWNVASEGSTATVADVFKISMGSGWASEADSTEALNNSSTFFEGLFDILGNEIANPMLTYEITEGSANLNPKPLADVSGAIAPTDPWYTSVEYKGAFDPAGDCNWLQNWTLLDQRGFIGCTVGIDEIASADKINIFPNPTSGEFNFTSDLNLQNVDLTVMNMNGQIVLQENNL
ncbi:MAG: T9SS type A sorting domain-containing protein, partial [Bacteroidota bacterium]